MTRHTERTAAALLLLLNALINTCGAEQGDELVADHSVADHSRCGGHGGAPAAERPPLVLLPLIPVLG